MRHNTSLLLRNKCVQRIFPRILQYGAVRTDIAKTKQKKYAIDVASAADLLIDTALHAALKKSFPHDAIVSEEVNPGVVFGSGYTWIIDPICGSANLARGVRFYSTNIALLHKGRVIAAWVIDHSRARLLWSIGGHSVSANRERLPRPPRRPAYQMLNIDQGYVHACTKITRTRYAKLYHDLLVNENLGSCVMSLGSSLGFAYVATGQIQGSVTIDVNPWDSFAAAFLVEQNGGRVTTFSGEPWTTATRSFVFSSHAATHVLLLRLLRRQGLQHIQ